MGIINGGRDGEGSERRRDRPLGLSKATLQSDGKFNTALHIQIQRPSTGPCDVEMDQLDQGPGAFQTPLKA